MAALQRAGFRAGCPEEPLQLEEGVEVPRRIASLLKPFQCTAVRFLHRNYKKAENCILNDEQTMGKRTVLLAFLLAVLESSAKKCLVVVKSEDRIAQWACRSELLLPEKEVRRVGDGDLADLKQRGDLFLSDAENFKVNLVDLANVEWDVVVADETVEFFETDEIKTISYLVARQKIIVASEDLSKHLGHLFQLSKALFSNKVRIKDESDFLERFQNHQLLLGALSRFRLRQFASHHRHHLPLVPPGADSEPFTPIIQPVTIRRRIQSSSEEVDSPDVLNFARVHRCGSEPLFDTDEMSPLVCSQQVVFEQNIYEADTEPFEIQQRPRTPPAAILSQVTIPETPLTPLGLVSQESYENLPLGQPLDAVSIPDLNDPEPETPDLNLSIYQGSQEREQSDVERISMGTVDAITISSSSASNQPPDRERSPELFSDTEEEEEEEDVTLVPSVPPPEVPKVTSTIAELCDSVSSHDSPNIFEITRNDIFPHLIRLNSDAELSPLNSPATKRPKVDLSPFLRRVKDSPKPQPAVEDRDSDVEFVEEISSIAKVDLVLSKTPPPSGGSSSTTTPRRSSSGWLRKTSGGHWTSPSSPSTQRRRRRSLFKTAPIPIASSSSSA